MAGLTEQNFQELQLMKSTAFSFLFPSQVPSSIEIDSLNSEETYVCENLSWCIVNSIILRYYHHMLDYRKR